jgi:6-phosphogluconolactonase
MEKTKKVMVFEGEEHLIAYILDLWGKMCAESVSERGGTTVALSGGRTPVELYRRLAREEKTLPWDKTHIFLVDERFVPHDHKDSNYKMLQEALLSVVPIPESNVHPVNTGLPTPDEAAVKYEEEIVRHFRSGPDLLPRFDMILLGLGEDGHTASLFPGSGLLEEQKRLVGAVKLDAKLHDRVTLTFPVINNGRLVVFHVEGANKAEALEKVIDDKDPVLPASRVKPAAGDLLFLADRAAAGLLSKERYEKFAKEIQELDAVEGKPILP